MNFKLQHVRKDQFGVFGGLFQDGGDDFCVTLEHAYPNADGSFSSKILPGMYICKRGIHRIHWHQKEIDPQLAALGAKLVTIGGITLIEFETFEVLGVPDCKGILFHWGCENDNSDGCVLMGSTVQGNMIVESRITFEKFMKLQTGVDQFTLVVQ
jgi:hypothetical protein